MARLSMPQRSRFSTTAGPTMCRSFLETNRNASVTSSDWLGLPNADDSQQASVFRINNRALSSCPVQAGAVEMGHGPATGPPPTTKQLRAIVESPGFRRQIGRLKGE